MREVKCEEYQTDTHCLSGEPLLSQDCRNRGSSLPLEQRFAYGLRRKGKTRVGRYLAKYNHWKKIELIPKCSLTIRIKPWCPGNQGLCSIVGELVTCQLLRPVQFVLFYFAKMNYQFETSTLTRRYSSHKSLLWLSFFLFTCWSRASYLL